MPEGQKIYRHYGSALRLSGVTTLGRHRRTSRKSRHPGRSEAESRDPSVFAANMGPGSALRLSGVTTLGWHRCASRKNRHPGRSEAESRDPSVFAASMGPGSALRLSGVTTLGRRRCPSRKNCQPGVTLGWRRCASRKNRHPGRSEAESRDPSVCAASMDPGSALRLSGVTTLGWHRCASRKNRHPGSANTLNWHSRGAGLRAGVAGYRANRETDQ